MLYGKSHNFCIVALLKAHCTIFLHAYYAYARSLSFFLLVFFVCVIRFLLPLFYGQRQRQYRYICSISRAHCVFLLFCCVFFLFRSSFYRDFVHIFVIVCHEPSSVCFWRTKIFFDLRLTLSRLHALLPFAYCFTKQKKNPRLINLISCCFEWLNRKSKDYVYLLCFRSSGFFFFFCPLISHSIKPTAKQKLQFVSISFTSIILNCLKYCVHLIRTSDGCHKK